jgi:hypothetical protein
MNSSLLSSSMLGLLIGCLKWQSLEEKGMKCYHDNQEVFVGQMGNFLKHGGDYKSPNLLAHVWERMVD